MPARHDSPALPLAGVRVLDLTSIIFGPYASQVLADYGADVIKIEPPEGDPLRRTGPSTESGMAANFLGVNRNKRGIVLDLKTAAARESLLALVDTADVVMHSIRPQKLAAIGLESQKLRARNPRLVFASLLGFGDGGPYSGLPAYDDIIQGRSGAAGLMERQTGTPQYLPAIYADKTSGLVAAHAILAALFARERTGRGCHVEIPMFETMAAFNLVEHMYGMHFEPPLSPPGYPRVLNAWRRPYRTTDGYLCALPYTDAHWKGFFAEAGQPGLAADPRFVNLSQRTANVEELYRITGEIVGTRTTEAWLEAFGRLDIPASRIYRLEDLREDEHLQALGFFEVVEDPRMGKLVFPGIPVRFDGERAAVRVPPRLGEHTQEVLASLSPAKDRTP